MGISVNNTEFLLHLHSNTVYSFLEHTGQKLFFVCKIYNLQLHNVHHDVIHCEIEGLM